MHNSAAQFVSDKGAVMHRFFSQLAVSFSAAALLISVSTAQAPAANADAPVATAKATKPKKPFEPKSAKGKACSMKADEQNLRGKARKKFRADCMKAV
jgi:hypothetical protein